MDKVWTNAGTRLWLRQGDDLDFLVTVAIPRIEINDICESVVHWRCGYCNSLVEKGTKCPNCNGPKRARKRRARMFVSGYLPIERVLNELVAGFSLEVMHGFCGDPSDYDSGIRIAAMTDCKVDAKWIDDLSINDPEDKSVIILNLKVSGDFAVFFEDDECQMWK